MGGIGVSGAGDLGSLGGFSGGLGGEFGFGDPSGFGGSPTATGGLSTASGAGFNDTEAGTAGQGITGAAATGFDAPAGSSAPDSFGFGEGSFTFGDSPGVGTGGGVGAGLTGVDSTGSATGPGTVSDTGAITGVGLSAADLAGLEAQYGGGATGTNQGSVLAGGGPSTEALQGGMNAIGTGTNFQSGGIFGDNTGVGSGGSFAGGQGAISSGGSDVLGQGALSRGGGVLGLGHSGMMGQSGTIEGIPFEGTGSNTFDGTVVSGGQGLGLIGDQTGYTQGQGTTLGGGLSGGGGVTVGGNGGTDFTSAGGGGAGQIDVAGNGVLSQFQQGGGGLFDTLVAQIQGGQLTQAQAQAIFSAAQAQVNEWSAVIPLDDPRWQQLWPMIQAQIRQSGAIAPSGGQAFTA
jgi:hypothetical protein